MSDTKLHPNWKWLGDCQVCGKPMGYEHECIPVPVESDKQAAPVSAPPDEVDVAYDNVGRAWTGDKHRVPERDVPSKVSAGEVKRWGLVVRQGHALMDVVENGQWIPVADHLSAMKAMQERIATLEAELLSVAKEKMAAERDKNRAESELAAYKASLPERAKRAANIFGGSPSAIHQLAAIILAEMERK